MREYHYNRLVDSKKKANTPPPTKGTLTEADLNKGKIDNVLKRFQIPEDTVTFKAPPPDVER